MAKSKKNMNKFMQSAKFRVIAIAVVLIAVVVAAFVFWHYKSTNDAFKGEANVAHSPGIQSVPGAGNPSNAYIQAQNAENATESAQARKNASSFVPTITQSGFVGSTESFDQDSGSKKQTTHSTNGKFHCPLNKVVYMYKPNPASCTVPNLKLARKAGVTAEELRCQSCSCPALRLAGYTAGQLKATGSTASELKKCGFTLAQLELAGFNAKQLKTAGFTAKQLRNAGFSLGELASAGFNAKQLKTAGYSAGAIKKAGVGSSEKDQNAGKLAKICNVKALKAARTQGVSASVLKIKGCSLAALKAAGYTAEELKEAGFTAGQLKLAGFSDSDLKAAGFTSQQIKAAKHYAKICNVTALKKARMNGVSAAELKNKGCGVAALKAAGYSASDLKAAGFSASQLKAAGFSAKDLKDAGFTAKQLKAAGFSAKALKGAGYNASQLKAAGFTAIQLKKAGFSAKDLKAAGFTPIQLQSAGFDAKALKAAGFSAKALKAFGFNAGQLEAAGFSAKALKKAGFTAKQLRDAGFSSAALKNAGYMADQLRKAGYTKGDLLRAGYTPAQAGYKTSVKTKKPVTSNANDDQGLQNADSQFGNDENTSHAGSSIPSINGDSSEARLRAIQRMQQQELNRQQQQNLLQQEQGQMSLQAQKLMSEWSNNSAQTYTAGIAKPAVSATGSSGSGKGANANTPSGPTIKAGKIMFAVLDTSVNSDEKSPILATIVTGKLKGTKLIGSFTRVDKKVLMKFKLMNIPSFDKSVSINAVAIDPDTARTAISGHVNNHYLLRYGSLFASAFLEGLSHGIIQSGATQDCFFGICHTTYQKLSPGEYVALGLGKVGQEYSSVMGDNFNTPPTIKIRGGDGIGILFMSDATLPGPLPQKKSIYQR